MLWWRAPFWSEGGCWRRKIKSEERIEGGCTSENVIIQLPSQRSLRAAVSMCVCLYVHVCLIVFIYERQSDFSHLSHWDLRRSLLTSTAVTSQPSVVSLTKTQTDTHIHTLWSFWQRVTAFHLSLMCNGQDLSGSRVMCLWRRGQLWTLLRCHSGWTVLHGWHIDVCNLHCSAT